MLFRTKSNSISNKTMIINRTILSLYIYTFFVKLGQIFIRIYKGSFKKEKKGGRGANEMENNVKYRTSLVTTLFDMEPGAVENRK